MTRVSPVSVYQFRLFLVCSLFSWKFPVISGSSAFGICVILFRMCGYLHSTMWFKQMRPFFVTYMPTRTMRTVWIEFKAFKNQPHVSIVSTAHFYLVQLFGKSASFPIVYSIFFLIVPSEIAKLFYATEYKYIWLFTRIWVGKKREK